MAHRDAYELDVDRLRADVCVVGAGAAGITIARALRGSGRKVVLVESGGFELADETDALGRGESPSIAGEYLLRSRKRVFGGTTQHWTGMCLPLADEVFTPRPEIDEHGWPIDADAMHPFYVRACEQLRLVPWARNGELERRPELTALEFDARPGFETRIYQRQRRFDFGQVFRRELLDAKDVLVLTHATVTGLVPEGDRVGAARIQTLEGKTLTLHADAFVLATGGIENARLLLVVEREHPGLAGRGAGLAGRYYMDHPELDIGEAVLWPSWDLGLYYGGWLDDDRRGFAAWFPSAKLQRERGVALAGIRPGHAGRRFGDADDRGLDAALASAAFGLDCARNASHECLPAAAKTRLFARCEQRPSADNRVELTDEVDAFGVPRPRLQWQLDRRDYDGYRKAIVELGKSIIADGVGRVRPRLPAAMPEVVRTIYGPSATREQHDQAHEDGEPLLLVWGHHMGTTRMSSAPTHGVVDPDCRVHGVPNLFMAGSSAFPTGGAANPTLTIVALALRLADHLAAR